MFGLVTQFQNVYSGTHHSQAAEFKLFLASFTEVGRSVKHQFPGYFTILYPKVLHITNHVSALVHVQQYRVSAILLHTHARCQHTASVAVQAVV